MKSYFKSKIWPTNDQDNYVPSRQLSSSLSGYSCNFTLTIKTIIIILATTINFIPIFNANAVDSYWQQPHEHANKLYTSLPDTLGYKQHISHEVPSHLKQKPRLLTRLGSNEPTPPLTNSFSSFRNHNDARKYLDTDHAYQETYQQSIWPQRVMRAPRSLEPTGPDLNFMSAVFQPRSIENTQQQASFEKDGGQFNIQSDANNLDLVEQGSGSGWPDGMMFPGADEVTTLIDPSMINSAILTNQGPLNTPMFEQMPSHPGSDNPPILMRRVPKLIATSGLAWKYTIPSDTFQDEDGDLRQLKSFLIVKEHLDKYKTIEDYSQQETFAKNLRWLRYDQNTQTIHGLPTDDDVGRREYVLQVYDRWNSSNNETIEITVRRHQSSRAFINSESTIRGPNPLDTEPRVKNRLGKLRWKLGQPIIYHIPNDVFVLGGETKINRNVTLTLHTIDGKALDQDSSYDFLEFDEETQTIFGLPYDYSQHVGQRELLLTGSDPRTNQMARETFVIDIESQDLTTINNRAFRMSLYFMFRANALGPREKVQISRRMISALQLGELNYSPDQDRPDFTVIDIQQFATSSNLESSTALIDPANAWRYQDKIHLVSHANPASNGEHSISGGSTFYKFTWTNETIGYRGECPVEVIKENILYALERSMIEYIQPNGIQRLDDNSKNDSVRFYERLRSYFEPELDLIHLRFEPLGACIDALELHDVGNSDVADSSDRAGDLELSTEPPAPTSHIRSTEVVPKLTKEISPVNSDEYWAIVVLIILVIAIIFVVMMLFMGLHTYRINQEKRFELQLKLAQARQNSMYLSSMMLADQSYASDILTRQAAEMALKPAYLDERSSRKPVILDTEKQLLTNGHPQVPMYKPTSVHLTGNSVQTMPLRQNTNFTIDSFTNIQNSNNNIGNASFNNTAIATTNQQQMFANGRHQSMTLNRRVVGTQARPIGRQASMSQLSQSQSILTVASTGTQGPYVPHSQAAMPFVYAPMPVFYESSVVIPHEL